MVRQAGVTESATPGQRHPEQVRKQSLGSVLVSYGVLLVAVFLFILFSVLQPQFITTTNILTIIRQASILGMLGLGLTTIVLVGEFDISFVAIATFAGVLPVILLMRGVNFALGMAIGVGFGVALALANAFNVIKLGIPSFIASLGMMVIITGVSRAFTGGITTYPKALPVGFGAIGRYQIGGIVPVTVLVFGVAALVVILLLDYTPKGRYIYATGGNPSAAMHVGINIRRVKLYAYLLAGVLFGIAGITMCSMFGSCSPNMGEGYLNPGIIATFLGAAFLTEGVPNPRGTVVSAILLAILNNGFTMINVPFYGRTIIQGVVLLISVGLLVGMRKRRQAT
jgi:ribose/xylose/arabinose/galactoside ABC-type transport system permease subunit